jgi:hypothetical protein
MPGATTLAVLLCLQSLGDQEYPVREEATRFLSGAQAAGELGILLELVIEGDDVEACRRAERVWAAGMGFRTHPLLLDLPYDTEDTDLVRAWDTVRCSHRAAASRRGLRTYAGLLGERAGKEHAVKTIREGMARWQSLLDQCNQVAQRIRWRRRAFWRIRHRILAPYEHPDPWDDE